eukprot:3089951-Ditylum_brightwellii.AAC.1
MQQQSVTPAPSVTLLLSPYPPQYYQPAANAMMQQHIRVVIATREEVETSASANNSSSSSISVNQSPTNTVGHMEVVTTLVQPVAIQPKVTDLMLPSKTR